jgi:L-ascorbate metabolism protein UlaG (beta-lactamase superfamily)
MNIKKICHCCLLIKIDGLTILTDPGTYSNEQNTLTGVDVVLISHEHGDHLHTESVGEILKNNPQAIVVANSAVGKKLDEVGIPHTILEGQDSKNIGGLNFEAFDCRHGEIYEEMGQVQNTAYLINGKFYYPGDAFFDPKKEGIEVLALPVAGPWVKIADAIHFALAVKPKYAFPVHDAMIKENNRGFMNMFASTIFSPNGINFVELKDGDQKDF